jgi:hypothetical protein
MGLTGFIPLMITTVTSGCHGVFAYLGIAFIDNKITSSTITWRS